MRIDVVTIFPAQMQQTVAFGVTGRALERGIAEMTCWSPRDFSGNRHGDVDDRPFGGGPGMVMQAQPLSATLQAVRASDERPAKVACLSPQGQVLRQAQIERLARRERIILICGRYEGIDERFIQREVDEEWSIGDYVLSGGELAAAVLIDAVIRRQPGALGDSQSSEQDSFMTGLLDCPHYTRPEVWAGLEVPSVLTGGDHAAIARWRREQALERTGKRRPELLDSAPLSEAEQERFKVLLKDKKR